MRKVDRLFEILQLLRGQRMRTADFIANELGVSVRTIYRDIQGLMASGVPIEGERGVGYIIQQPIELPPLHFTPLELQALQLGIKMVSATADGDMAKAADEASLKILDASPEGDSRPKRQQSATHVYFRSDETSRRFLALLRDAVEVQKRVEIVYHVEGREPMTRQVRPLGLEYWGKVWTLTAWCEIRQDFRVFRIDRIENCRETGAHFTSEKGKTYQDYLAQIRLETKNDGR